MRKVLGWLLFNLAFSFIGLSFAHLFNFIGRALAEGQLLSQLHWFANWTAIGVILGNFSLFFRWLDSKFC